MRLVIEDIQIPGPNGHPTISVAHYGEQNGDADARPGNAFRAGRGWRPRSVMVPYYFRNDYVGVEQYSRLTLRTEGAG